MADAPEKSRIKSVLDDPGSQAIARVYSTAFLDAAGDESAERVEEFESFVSDVLQASAEFTNLFCTGLMNRDEKLGVIDRVVAPNGSEFFANFLRVLARHDRLELLEAVLETVKLEHEKRTGRRRVQVASARPLDATLLERVTAQLGKAFDFEPIVENQTDAGLIGGLVIRVGNSVYDGSLRTRLNQLAKRMQQRSLHEIQSGRDRFSSPEGD